MQSETKPIIEVKGVSKFFGEKTALDNINLSIKKGEFVTILGPSGCGKTTLLRLIAGFQTASEGVICIASKEITQTPPHKRPVNTVFQKYALFPHLNVFENVAFGLRLKKMDEETIRRKVRDMLEVVGLKGFERRSISQMSGGQQQRVAIARALAAAPAIILADEPTGNLDSKTSQDVLSLLKVTSQKFAQTIVMITHNEEIAQMADRIIRIEDGRIVSQN